MGSELSQCLAKKTVRLWRCEGRREEVALTAFAQAALQELVLGGPAGVVGVALQGKDGY